MTLTDPITALTAARAAAPAAAPADAAASEAQLTEWGARLDGAVAAIQGLDGESRAVAEEFALALDQVTRTALTTMVKRLRADPRGAELLYELVDDPAVRLVLGMHGIIRLPDPAGIPGSGTAPGAAASEHAATAPARDGRTFISLSSMLRGPQTGGHACGCGGDSGDGCACGGH